MPFTVLQCVNKDNIIIIISIIVTYNIFEVIVNTLVVVKYMNRLTMTSSTLFKDLFLAYCKYYLYNV